MGQKDIQQEQFDDYWNAINAAAELIVAELRAVDEAGRDELLSCLIFECCDQHDYVIRDDLNFHTLLYSENACAGFFNGTFSTSGYASGDPFPFAELAADAFDADLTRRVQLLLGNEMTPVSSSDNPQPSDGEQSCPINSES